MQRYLLEQSEQQYMQQQPMRQQYMQQQPMQQHYMQHHQPMQQHYMEHQQLMQQQYPAYGFPPPFPAYFQTHNPSEPHLHAERLKALLIQKDKEIQQLKEKEYLRTGTYGDV